MPNGSRPGLIARFAGGHAFWLMDCSALESGNCTPRYELDAAGYEAYEAAHPDVADGTFVRKASGSGAGTIGRAAGVRTSFGDPTGAIDVNDATVAQFLDGDPPRDADADGVNPPLDCDDARADIRPGARDTPGDGVDQDCSGADAAYPKLDLLVGAFFNTRGSRTNLTSFYVRSVPAGTKLTLRCSGRGCPFKSTSVTLKKGKSRFSLLSRMKKAKLRTGARLELR